MHITNATAPPKRRLHITPRAFVISIITAIIIAGGNTLGTAHSIYNGMRDYINNDGTPRIGLTFIAVLTGSSLITLILSTWTSKKPSHMKKNDETTVPPIKFTILMDKTFVIMTLVTIALWLVWIIPHYPGTMRDDTINQLAQWYGLTRYYTQHPITSTLIIGSFASIGDMLGTRMTGLFILIIIQAIVTAMTLSLSARYMRRIGTPKQIVLGTWSLTILTPATWQAIDAISKDMLNAMLLPLMLIIIAETARTHGKWLTEHKKRIFWTITLAIYLTLTKRVTGYILMLAWFIIAISIAKHKSYKSEKDITGHHDTLRATIPLSIAIIPTIIITIAITPLLNATLNTDTTARDTNPLGAAGLPLNQAVRSYVDDTNHSIPIPDHDTQLLSNIVTDPNTAIQTYNPHRIDEIGWITRDDATYSQLLDLWSYRIDSHAASYMNAWLDLAGGWMTLHDRITYAHSIKGDLDTPERMKTWTTVLAKGDKDKANKFINYLTITEPEELTPIKQAENTIYSTILMRMPLLDSTGLYCFTIPVITLSILITRKNRWGIVTMGPILAQSLTYAIGPMALYWYSIPSLVTLPIIGSLPLTPTGTYEPDHGKQTPASTTMGQKTDVITRAKEQQSSMHPTNKGMGDHPWQPQA